jgi:Zn-finger nucleic acid-binding protein
MCYDGRMSACNHCGAPIAFGSATSATCGFCDVVNDAPARTERVAVPVEVVHNVIQVTSAEAAQVLRCARCRQPLVTIRALDLELHGCGSCGGIWVDNESAARMLRAPDEVFEDLARKCAASARLPGPRYRRPECAVCQTMLEVVRTPAASVDICKAHGTWFDAHELAAVIADLRAKAGGVRVADGLRAVLPDRAD